MLEENVNELKAWFMTLGRLAQRELEGNLIFMRLASSFFLPIKIPPICYLELRAGPFLYQVPWLPLGTEISLGFGCLSVLGQSAHQGSLWGWP